VIDPKKFRLRVSPWAPQVRLTSRAHLRGSGDGAASRCVDGFDDAENVVAGCVLSGFVTGVTDPVAGARNDAVRRTI